MKYLFAVLSLLLFTALVSAQTILEPGEGGFEIQPIILDLVADFTGTNILGLDGTLNYLNIRWNARYLDGADRDIGVDCYLNCPVPDPECPPGSIDNGDGTCTYTATPATVWWRAITASGTGSTCPSPSTKEDATGSTLAVYWVRDSGINGVCRRSAIKFDISVIPDDASIEDVIVKFDVASIVTPTRITDWNEINTDPDIASATDLWNDIGDGTTFVSASTIMDTVGDNKELDLGFSAYADLENQLPSDWFAVGVKANDENRDSSNHASRADDEASGNPRWTLEVTFIPQASLDVICAGYQSCSYLGPTGEHSCSISNPNYDFTVDNDVKCRFYDPLNPSIDFLDPATGKIYIERIFRPIDFELSVSAITVTLGEAFNLPINVKGLGLIPSSYTVNITTLQNPEAAPIEKAISFTEFIAYNDIGTVFPRIVLLLAQDFQFKILAKSSIDPYTCADDNALCRPPIIERFGTGAECIDNACHKRLDVTISAGNAVLSEFGLFGLIQIIFIAAVLLLIKL